MEGFQHDDYVELAFVDSFGKPQATMSAAFFNGKELPDHLQTPIYDFFSNVLFPQETIMHQKLMRAQFVDHKRNVLTSYIGSINPGA